MIHEKCYESCCLGVAAGQLRRQILQFDQTVMIGAALRQAAFVFRYQQGRRKARIGRSGYAVLGQGTKGIVRSGLEGVDPQPDRRPMPHRLRDRIRELGGEASDSSGAWGVWAKTVQGTMNLFGDASSLKALKEGEEHGLKDYQEAVNDVDASTAQLIQNQLIPAQQRHINLLDQLITSVGTA